MNLPMITVYNRQRRVALDREDLQSFAQRALPLCLREKASRLNQFSELEVNLISDRRMAQLHRQFMGLDGSTDVITFQHGEIFLSVETARRQAAVYRTSLGYELRLYLVHGLLHLAGFDDSDANSGRRMQRMQKRIAALADG